MKTALYSQPRHITFQETPEPMVQGPDDIKIRIQYAGICDDDIVLYTQDENSTTWPLPIPITGHEFAGTVVDLGKSAQRNGFKIGDRVSGLAWSFCGTCSYCKRGMENHCVNISGISAFAPYVVANQKQICRLPENVPLINGVFTDPVTYCLYNSTYRLQSRPAHSALIIGSTAMAFILLQILRKQGIYRIVMALSNPRHRQLALSLGASDVIDLDSPDFYSQALRCSEQEGYDFVYEMSRNPDMLNIAAQLVACRGHILFSYMYQIETKNNFSLMDLYFKEATLRSFSLAPYMLPDAMHILPHLELQPLIGKLYPFEQINEAFADHLRHEHIKIVLEI